MKSCSIIMTKLITTITISAIASILVIGGFVLAPDAYSEKNHHHDDVPDECSCEKPHTLKVNLKVDNALPTIQHTVEIFKNLDDRDNEEKQLGSTILVDTDGDFMVLASNFNKEKLESNTAFVVYRVPADVDEEGKRVPISLMEIHTSCSKPLFITMIEDDMDTTNNGYTLEVLDGLQGDNPPMTSIPIDEPSSCEDKKHESTGTITVRKAITNDNGGTKDAKDFVMTVTNVETPDDPVKLVHVNDFVSTIDVPAGTYVLSEADIEGNTIVGYTTVLVAGDTHCPSMVGEEFTIKKNKNISCTVYNDDNVSGDGGPIEPGVIFHTDTVQFDLSTEICNVTDDVDKSTILPCAVFDGNSNYMVVPNLLPNENLHETTLVLLTVMGVLNDGTPDPFATTGCTLETVYKMTGDELTDPDGTGTFGGPLLGNGDLTSYPMFSFQCSNGPMSTSGLFNANFALIETAMQTP